MSEPAVMVSNWREFSTSRPLNSDDVEGMDELFNSFSSSWDDTTIGYKPSSDDSLGVLLVRDGSMVGRVLMALLGPDGAVVVEGTEVFDWEEE